MKNTSVFSVFAEPTMVASLVLGISAIITTLIVVFAPHYEYIGIARAFDLGKKLAKDFDLGFGAREKPTIIPTVRFGIIRLVPRPLPPVRGTANSLPKSD